MSRHSELMRAYIHILPGICSILSLGSGIGLAAPPPGYYDQGNRLVGGPLKDALHDIIDDHTVIFYSQTDEVMRVVDKSPVDQSRIELIYSTFSMPSSDIGSSGQSVWNREHVWPRSFGIGNDGADNSDLHNLYPCNASVNSSRGNKFFDYSDPGSGSNSISPENTFDGNSWEPDDFDKGKVARAAFYAAVRYDGSDFQTEDLELSDFPDTSTARMGKLTTLLQWHREFPPTVIDKARNEALFTGVQTTTGFLKQGNRNPFIDYPQLADAVFLPAEIWTWSKWQVQSFRIDLLDDPVSGPLSDRDRDGFVNLLEFVGASEPNDARSRPLIEIEPEGDDMIIRFRKVKNLELSGYTSVWETSEDLKHWTAIREESFLVNDEGETTVQEVRFTRTVKKAFCRLRVSAIVSD